MAPTLSKAQALSSAADSDVGFDGQHSAQAPKRGRRKALSVAVCYNELAKKFKGREAEVGFQLELRGPHKDSELLKNLLIGEPNIPFFCNFFLRCFSIHVIFSLGLQHVPASSTHFLGTTHVTSKDVYGYQEEDITVLMDAEGYEERRLPKRENIVRSSHPPHRVYEAEP